MCRIFIIIGILINLLYFYKGCEALNWVHSIQKRQSQNEYEVTVIDTDNLASGLQQLLNTVQQATNMGQQFQIGRNQGKGQNYQGQSPGGPPGRRPPGGRPDFGPPPGGPNHFGPPGHRGHPPPPPPPPHEGPPGGPPGWPGFGPPGPPYWQGSGHHGPPDPPPDYGRPPPPPHEGHHGHRPPHNHGPPNNHNNRHEENNSSPIWDNSGNIPGQNEDKDKKNIVGYLDGNFPIILLEDNEIR